MAFKQRKKIIATKLNKDNEERKREETKGSKQGNNFPPTFAWVFYLLLPKLGIIQGKKIVNSPLLYFAFPKFQTHLHQTVVRKRPKTTNTTTRKMAVNMEKKNQINLQCKKSEQEIE